MRALDDFLPVYEFSERHSLAIDAPAGRIDEAFRSVSISDIPVARALWWVRRLGRPYGDPTKPFIGGDLPGVVLDDVPQEGVVLGLTGQFWRVLGGARDAAAPTTRDEFIAYARADSCKAVVDFRIGPKLAFDRDARARRRLGRASAVPPILARRATVQRAHPDPAAARGTTTSGGCRMKLVTFDYDRVGYIEGDEIVVLDVPSMRELFEAGGADEAGERVRLDQTELRAPIVPKKFFHTAGNFREHEEESKQVGWSHEIAPWIVFFQNVDAIVGPDEPVVYPEHLTEELDYELELAVVIKQEGKWFSPEEAVDYIGGYVIFNDITARDIQRREMRSGVFSFCKAIDTFCPLGPWIVTPDEIPDPHDLAMELRVNGEVRQTSHSSRMSVTIPEILSHYSALGYSAGDVVSTGTVSGVAGFSPDAASLYLKPGDVMECEIERIGVLRNPVVSWEEAHFEPAPPRIRW